MKNLFAICTVLFMLVIASSSSAQPGYWIAFQSNRDGSDDIFIVNTAGDGVRNLTANRAADRHPDWSADGLQIAFASDRGGNNDIYIMDNNGENVINVTNNSANDNSPDWSPDGLRIAFISDREGGSDVYAIEWNTGVVTRLTTDGTRKSAPAWSPDGHSITYWEGAEGEEKIATLNLISGSPLIITSGAPASWPSWSPDGEQIAFFQTTSANTDILSVTLGSGEILNLTNNPAADIRPAYSSNGQIAFASDRDGNIELYVMEGDGSFPQRLTFNDAEDTSPAWQPVPAAILPTQASAVVVQNGLQLSTNSDVSGNRYANNGQGRIYAPTEPVTPDELIVIRLEIEPDSQVLSNAAATLPDSEIQTDEPIAAQEVEVYEILGAELTGVDLERFRIEPTPTDYVLRLDMNDTNYWEWTLRARDLNSIGMNYLGVRVYALLEQPDGTVAEREVFNNRFTIEVINVSSPIVQNLPAESLLPQQTTDTQEGEGVFALVLDGAESITLIALGDADLSDLTLTGAGYQYGEFEVLSDFPALTSLSWERGVCVVYLSDGSDYRPPRICDPSLLFEYSLNNFDVFWYDDTVNTPRTIVVRYAQNTFICSNAADSCEFP